MRILVVSDTHIPDRAEWVPKHVEEAIRDREPYDVVVHCGDLTSRDVLEWLSTLAPKVVAVKGNMDYLPLPVEAKLEVDGLRVGVYHGTGIYPRGDPRKLSAVARRMGVEVLLTGHTHAPAVVEWDGVLILNPGSLTGVWGGGGGSMKPSFMVVEVEGGRLVGELLEDAGGEMVVTRRFRWP